MTPFDLVEPQTLQEAIALLDPDDPAVRPVAGGTALMLMMKAGVFAPTRLVGLQRIEERFSTITFSTSGELRIGAMATLGALERDKSVAKAYPIMAQMLPALSNVRVRNVACVGGALAHGDPHMDLPPVLAALDAHVVIAGPDGNREAKVDELYTGYYETILGRNELIATVYVPPLQGRKAAYVKVTARSADDWPALGLAISFTMSGDRMSDVRVVASAATDRLVRLTETEAALHDSVIDDGPLKRAAEIAAGEAPIIADVRGSVAYKRELLRVYLGRAVQQALTGKPVH